MNDLWKMVLIISQIVALIFVFLHLLEIYQNKTTAVVGFVILAIGIITGFFYKRKE
ncbi:MAG: hypothetical protein JXQ90_13625 [Cyclobacteriaceae bacterium]